MSRATKAVVHLRDDTRGSADLVALERGEGIVEVTLEDGRILEAPASAFERRGDGSYVLPLTVGEGEDATSVGSAVGSAQGETVVPIVVEEAVVSKQKVETGRVRIHKTVRERQEVVDQPLVREEVEVRRVPVDRLLDGPAEVRHEGETMIVPVVEEVLVVEKRLRVREELHITRRKVEERHPQTVTLRVEQATVERVAPTRATTGRQTRDR